MVNMLEQEMKQCIHEFYNLYNMDHYISKKEYEKYLDKYRDLFSIFSKYSDVDSDNYRKMTILSQNGYQMIDNHNDKFVSQKLEEYREYFDHMFDDIDSNILLDDDQRKAIIIDEDYSLVIAGAGSGKTTTMAAKVKYLVEKKHVKPKEIILLAFTRKAADELDERINGDFKLGVEVLTFHKLGLDFIRKIKKEKVSVIDSAGQYQMFSEYVRDIIFPNKDLLHSLKEAFSDEIFFDERCYEYASFDEYWKYYSDMKYDQCLDYLSDENERRIQSRTKYYKTINGEYVKSESEVRIANYLYKCGIPYRYEEVYSEKLDHHRTYKPDFTIYLDGDPIYLEYFGLAKLCLDGSVQSIDPDYQRNVLQKRNIHLKNSTDMIELYGQYEDHSHYMYYLEEELKKRNFVFCKRSEKDIFYRLMDTSRDSLFRNFISLMILFISLFKEQNYQKEDLEQLILSVDDDHLKQQLKIVRAFYLQYELDLRKNGRIDFADMINFSYHHMEQLKEQYQFLKYQYVIIDEYQDISKQRYNFTKRLSDLFDAKIVAVGDDWQAIFSFSGSDVELFTKFYESMGYAEIVKITKTYRNSQELIDIAGEFVSRNASQFQKRLLSDKHLSKPVELIKYDINVEYQVNGMAKKLREVLLRIYQENPDDNVLLLGRYRNDVDTIIDSPYFKKGYGACIIFNECPSMKIDFLTVHSAKGLGYDQVILLNALNDLHGFPSKIEDHSLIKLIRNDEQSSVDYPEERRLFYVALTRTKNRVFIMCPLDISLVSSFVKEIIGHPNVLY